MGDWLEAQVIETSPDKIKVHYNGWAERWDEWIPIASDRIRLFRSRTIQNPSTPFLSPYPGLPLRAGNANLVAGEGAEFDCLLERYCMFC